MNSPLNLLQVNFKTCTNFVLAIGGFFTQLTAVDW